MKYSKPLKVYEYLIAGALAALVIVGSPYGIRILSGRTALSFRISFISIVIDAILLLFIGALLARGALRRAFFWSILVLFPVAMVLGLEALAQAVHLADRVAPLADMSVFMN
jgi:hypothetical protein